MCTTDHYLIVATGSRYISRMRETLMYEEKAIVYTVKASTCI
jgi:hypothetical protein